MYKAKALLSIFMENPKKPLKSTQSKLTKGSVLSHWNTDSVQSLDSQGGKKALKWFCLAADAASRLQNGIVGDGYQSIHFTSCA